MGRGRTKKLDNKQIAIPMEGKGLGKGIASTDKGGVGSPVGVIGKSIYNLQLL